ncbi:MAG: PD40 domain-containing protein [Bacteroidales bacterium]|nr:PD40 domain-containing protein [Bacteroidales bacterium]
MVNFRSGKTYKILLRVILLLVIIAPGNLLLAQFYNGSQLTFGKNRVQYNEFFWTFYQFDKFDTYFYMNGSELAVFTAKYANELLVEIEDKLESSMGEKIQFIIYNNLSDLKQSNIGLLSDEHYNTGGITYIVGHKVFVYFDGSLDHFKKQIRAGIARVLVDQTLYGGTVGNQIKNTTLMALPEWYENGIISYVSENWSTEVDNFVKDGILSGRYEKFNQLMGKDAIYAGHAIWQYIAEKYGKTVVPNIIYMAKISRNVESGFLYVLGVSYKSLLKECFTHYTQKYAKVDESMYLPDVPPVLKKTKKNVVISQPKISPDGQYLTYTSNNIGKYKLWLRNVGTGKQKKIFKGGIKLDEKTDYSYPLIAWHPSGQLFAFIIEAKGQNYLYYYNLDTRKKEKRILYNFEKIVDISYSPDGSSFLFSAVQKGQSDLYIYSLVSNSFDRITNDIYDDLFPRFINNGKQIVFSSNRPDDTLRIAPGYEIYQLQSRYDLFLYDLVKRSNTLRRVTATPTANEFYPMEYEKGAISYLSDYNGIYNRYIARFDSAITYIDTTTHYRYFTDAFAVTNYSRSIIEQDINWEAGKFAEIIYKDLSYHLYIDDLPLFEELSAVELTNTSYAQNLQQENSKIEEENKGVSYGKRKKKSRFSNVHYYDNEALQEDKKVDINDYQFDQQSFIKFNVTETDEAPDEQLSGQFEKQSKFLVPKRRNYNVQYSINEMVSQIDFTYLNYDYQAFSGGGHPIYQTPGFNVFLKVGVTDLLEDYRITGGVRLSINLRNNEYILSFANLRKRLDKEILFHRKVFEEVGVYSLIKHYTHEFHYIVKYPFNPVLSIKGTFTLRNDKAVFLSTDQVNLKQPDQHNNWAVFKTEFIFDNTRSLGLNLYSGTRFKIFGEYYYLLGNTSGDVAVVGFDFRNYIKVHRTLIWANRFAGSTSLGTNKLIYYMGGVDNWVSPKFNVATPIDYSQNYMFQTLATSMRGFAQNIRNGNSFALITTELRFPVFRYFANRPLKSDFLNNFQIVGFGDIGTAWTGINPYSMENSLFTRIIARPPLNITVEIQKEPIVGGFGGGLRTRVFGYFLRADLAWGVEDWYILPSRFYFSLSLDF